MCYDYVSSLCLFCILTVYERICLTACVVGGGAERWACGQWVRRQHSEGVGLGLGPMPADALRSYWGECCVITSFLQVVCVCSDVDIACIDWMVAEL